MKKPNQKDRKPQGKRFRSLAFGLFSVLLCLCLIGGIALFAFYLRIEGSLPSVEALKNYQPPLVTSVYSADGKLIGEFYAQRRYLVSLNDLPPYVIKAFVAAEDAHFYQEGGVNFTGILRAAIRNAEAGKIVQGGSTITQQVVKSLLLTPKRTYTRKFKEAILAYRISNSLSKNEILNIYLNQIYLGAGAYGVEAAARTYFDKHASELDLAQAAILAGLPRAPNAFSPLYHLAAAKERQRYVLQRMADANFITYDQAKKALAEPLTIVTNPVRFAPAKMNSFTEEVRQRAEDRFGHEMLYNEGLTIYTTMVLSAQKMARRALDKGLREISERHRKYRGLHVYVPKDDRSITIGLLARSNGTLEQGEVVEGLVRRFDPGSKTISFDLGRAKALVPYSGWRWVQLSNARAKRAFRPGNVLKLRLQDKKGNTWIARIEQSPGMQGAIMSMSPITGAVICMVGGRHYDQSQFNRCTQALRQPGSSFKPLYYAAALDKGYTEASILIDSPITFYDHSLKGSWSPVNYDRRFLGPVLLRNCLIHSRNVPSVKLLRAIGIDYAIDYARRLGITTPLTHNLSLALGASSVTLEEMLSAYSTFPGLGRRVKPYLIDRVYDRSGKLIYQHRVHREQVISPQTAYLITNMLEGVVQKGTGKYARKLGRPCAGKTGTTNDCKDAWFIGYTPAVLTGVWVGYDDHLSSLGYAETGGRAACPIWTDFMQHYLQDKPVETFKIPDGIYFTEINDDGTVAGADDTGAVYAAFAKPVSTAGENTENQQEQAMAGAPRRQRPTTLGSRLWNWFRRTSGSSKPIIKRKEAAPSTPTFLGCPGA